ncbi:hypothetical protein VCHA34P121_10075 [Vibrio chagasii]|nr:hypothetical protein VCHA34P121_10075 [Vibrio chagasii]
MFASLIKDRKALKELGKLTPSPLKNHYKYLLITVGDAILS